MSQGYQRKTCGERHELPMSFGVDAPYWYDAVAPEERRWRAELGSDQQIVTHDGESAE
jgi:hypothetical protein